MKKKWMVHSIERVQADVIVGEISSQQRFFLATFFEQNLTLTVTNDLYYSTFELGFLDDFEDLENGGRNIGSVERSTQRKCYR